MTPEKFITGLLHDAGVTINGDRPHDLIINDERVFERVITDGSLGFGEAYMDGWFECERLDQLVNKVYANQLQTKIDKKDAFFALIRAHARSLGSKSRSYEIGKVHYDTGNELFRRMLDPYMMYSCGYWLRAETLEQAQKDKLELTCKKLMLEPGMRVLDIGCGWGGFARYAAEHYGVQVVGITVSEEQRKLGTELSAGLPVELRYQDYRKIDETFDRAVSIGMFEHVGHKYYQEYMDACARCLKPDGLFLLHTVGYKERGEANPWFDRYIMPGVAFPAMSQIMACAEPHFELEDFHNWEGSHYGKTLMAWFDNFNASWPEIKDLYDDRFYRMWKLYLQGCAGAFRCNRMRVWQLVFSREEFSGGYRFANPYPLD